MTRPAPRLWPLEPLMAAAGARYPNDLAVTCGMSNTTLHRAQTEGLTDAQADRYALRCDLHPAIVWPGWDDWALTHLPVPDDDTYEDLAA